MERLARAATERLFVDDVTLATEKTGLAHIYSEEGRQHVVAVEDGICSCEDYSTTSVSASGASTASAQSWRSAVAVSPSGRTPTRSIRCSSAGSTNGKPPMACEPCPCGHGYARIVTPEGLLCRECAARLAGHLQRVDTVIVEPAERVSDEPF